MSRFFFKKSLSLKKIASWIFSFSFLLFAFFITSNSIKAQENSRESSANENFSISLQSNYTVNAAGKTLVELKFKISNKTPEYFVSKYAISLSSTDLSKLEVHSNDQKIEPELVTENGRTRISIDFPDQILGEGKTRDLTISYVDADIAQISGKVLEVNIPKLADHYQYSSYQVNLKIPSIFGNPSRMNPGNFLMREEADFLVVQYQNLGDQAVSAIFGNEQIFDLKLNYRLENPSSQNALSQITLPPELANQEVFYKSLIPAASSIKEDADGNFIATYEIPANSSIDVSLVAKIRLLLSADQNLSANIPPTNQTAAMKYWDYSQAPIQNAAINLNDIEDIYKFTVKELNYTTQELSQDFPRLGANEALSEKQKDNATCQEFTDLFITLARLKNIPARRLVGYAYSNNQELRPVTLDHDILHAWPEYYDQESGFWKQVDPTWEDTTGGVDYFHKFDLNHIVFAINGLSSTMPYPAGSYLDNGRDSGKKIIVDFSQEDFPLVSPLLQIALEEKKVSALPIPGSYQLKIKNMTGKVWYFSELKLQSNALQIDYDPEKVPARLLPFAELSLPVMVYNREGLLSQTGKLQVQILFREGQSFAKEFEVSGFSKIQFQSPEKILAVGTSFLIIAFPTWGLFLLGRKWANHLRRKSQKSEKEAEKLQQISATLGKDQEDGQPSSGDSLSNPRQRT